MRVMMVGDVVGEPAAAWLARRVPELRREHGLDWIVVNAENCAVTGPSPMNGFGMTVEIVEQLVDAGVDAVTGGNHSWDGPDVEAVLSHPRVIRPINLDEELGRGIITLPGDIGRPALTVINLLSPTAELPGMNAPRPQPLWESWQRIRAEHHFENTRETEPPGSRRTKETATVIDLHGESPWEKASMAAAIDGEVAALVGTHTHDASLRGHVLPQGTGYVSELGMTGRLGFTGGGFDPAHFAARFRGEPYGADDLPPYELATGAFTLGAVVLDIRRGRTTGITRLV